MWPVPKAGCSTGGGEQSDQHSGCFFSFFLKKSKLLQVKIFWVVTPRSVRGGYHFGGPCCFYLQGEVNGAGKGAQK